MKKECECDTEFILPSDELPAYLVAGESQYNKPFRLVLLVQCLKVLVLGCRTSIRRSIHHKRNTSREKVGVLVPVV